MILRRLTFRSFTEHSNHNHEVKMASYAMESSPGADGQKEPDSKKISFRFCREWSVHVDISVYAVLTHHSSNMLYPKEDHVEDKLMFACRTCQFSEEAGASCIYRNSLKETIAETPGNVQDVAQDPTVGDAEGLEVGPEF